MHDYLVNIASELTTAAIVWIVAKTWFWLRNTVIYREVESS